MMGRLYLIPSETIVSQKRDTGKMRSILILLPTGIRVNI